VDQRFTALEFREGVSGGRMGLRGGPDVWEVVMVARDYDGDLDGLTAHFGGLVAADALTQALEYAEQFPEEVESRIEQNLRTERMLRFGGRG
jgi:hypothetical protein